MLSQFFRKKGYEITIAGTGPEAMEMADQGQFDLAIVDINLAGESGLQLLGCFKSNFPKLPVIMFTGMTGDEALLDQALARGASGFMHKTQSLDDLFAAVQCYVPKP